MGKVPNILVITAQPKSVLESMGFTDDGVWFKEALGDACSVELLYAPDGRFFPNAEPDGIIIGGSAHSVHDNEEWIKELRRYAKIMFRRSKPLLGVCFGAQLLTDVLKGTVGSCDREFGFCRVELTEAGRKSPIFQGLPQAFSVAESHSEHMHLLPHSARLLAANGTGAQAVMFDETTFAVQFHPEVTPAILRKVANARREALEEEGFICNGRRQIGTGGIGALMANIDCAITAVQTGRIILQNFVRNVVVPAAEKAALAFYG